MPVDILKVEGNKVVHRDGTPIILRGSALGGWMNMENVRLRTPRRCGLSV